MPKKKRKRSDIRKRQQTILRFADKLQSSGIDVSRRYIVVGGTQPKSVRKARKENETREMDPSDCGPYQGNVEKID